MHAYLIEIHYVELAEINMSQRCKILVQHYLYSYLKGSDNIHSLCVKIKYVTKELRKNTLKISACLCRQLFFSV